MNGNRCVVTFLALALLGSTGLAPQNPQDRATGFVLDVGEHDLLELIDRAGAYLGRNYFKDPAVFAALPGQATFEITRRLELDALGCEEVLSQILYMKGFAIVVRDRSKELYEVVMMQGPKRTEIQSGAEFLTPEEILRRPNLKRTVLTSVPLEHIQVQVATNSLRPFFASTGQVGAPLTLGNVGNNRAILLQGFTDQVAAAIRLLRTVDVPPLEAEPVTPPVSERLEALERRVRELEAKHEGR